MSDAQAPSYLWTPHGPGFIAQKEHTLRASVWCAVAGVTVTIAAVMIGDDGSPRPTLYTVNPTSDGVKTSPLPFALEQGQLSSIHAFVSAGSVIGAQCFVRLELVQGREGGTTPVGTIAEGYVTNNTALAYPGDNTSRPVDGRGSWRLVLGTVPAAGAEFVDTVPANRRWALQAVAFLLTTSAAVANRTPVLTIDDGANIIWEASNNANVVASTAAKFRAGAGVQQSTITANDFAIALPEILLLPAGSRIRTVTGGLQGADAYTAIVYNVEEYFDV